MCISSKRVGEEDDEYVGTVYGEENEGSKTFVDMAMLIAADALSSGRFNAVLLAAAKKAGCTPAKMDGVNAIFRQVFEEKTPDELLLDAIREQCIEHEADWVQIKVFTVADRLIGSGTVRSVSGAPSTTKLAEAVYEAIMASDAQPSTVLTGYRALFMDCVFTQLSKTETDLAKGLRSNGGLYARRMIDVLATISFPQWRIDDYERYSDVHAAVGITHVSAPQACKNFEELYRKHVEKDGLDGVQSTNELIQGVSGSSRKDFLDTPTAKYKQSKQYAAYANARARGTIRSEDLDLLQALRAAMIGSSSYGVEELFVGLAESCLSLMRERVSEADRAKERYYMQLERAFERALDRQASVNSTALHMVSALRMMKPAVLSYAWAMRLLGLPDGDVRLESPETQLRSLLQDYDLLSQVANKCQICDIAAKPPVHKYNVLCCDGGGVKGCAAVEMLLKIFTAEEEKIVDGDRRTMQVLPKSKKAPHEVFDLICGTSTGSFIAYGLAVLRLPLKKIAEMYRDLATGVFSEKTTPNYVTETVTEKWKTKPLRDQIIAFTTPPTTAAAAAPSAHMPALFSKGVSTTILGDDVLAPDKRIPLFFCTATDIAKSAPRTVLLNNYTHLPRGALQENASALYAYEVTSKLYSWQALRSSSAAPTFFAPFVMNPDLAKSLNNQYVPSAGGSHHDLTRCVLIDGGVGQNNPSFLGYSEAARVFGGAKNIGVVVSVGVGADPTKQDNKDIDWFLQNAPYEQGNAPPQSSGLVASISTVASRAKAFGKGSLLSGVIGTATGVQFAEGLMREIERTVGVRYFRINFEYDKITEMDNPKLMPTLVDAAKRAATSAPLDREIDATRSFLDS